MKVLNESDITVEEGGGGYGCWRERTGGDETSFFVNCFMNLDLVYSRVCLC